MGTQSSNAGIAREIDRLVQIGRIDAAANLLQRSVASGEVNDPLSAWLQLAGMRRALRQPQQALAAVHGALALSPLNFIALVMRASLLAQGKDDGAGLAWSQALAQRPDGDLPEPLAAAVAAGQRVEQAWIDGREKQMNRVTAAVLENASAEASKRIGRFQSNVLRKTRAYHREPTHFHFPELVEREFHSRERFQWIADIETNTNVIREEMKLVMGSERAELVPYIQYGNHEALAQWRSLNGSRDWTAIHLINKGVRVENNADLCPATMKMLASMQQPEIVGASPNAMFSLLAPNTSIPPHVGVNNTRLVVHLPLIVPKGCWLRVGAETKYWQEGEAIIFDDTIEHEAVNPTEFLRVVLIFDIWHPDLDASERAAVSHIVAAESGEAELGL